MIKIGNLNIDKIYLGISDDVEVYLGTVKVWPEDVPPTPFSGKYKFTLTDDSVVSGECDSSTSELVQNEVTAYTATLKEAEIGDCVTSIGSYAFSYCSSLTSIDIPSSVTSIGNRVFDSTPWWNTYSADTSHHYGNIIYINDVAYKATSTEITSCTFKEGTVSISNEAFLNCSGLTSINIPNSVTRIGYRAFRYCSGLTNIEIPDSVTSLDNQVFSHCYGLTSCTIGSGVTTIGSSLFSNCSGLTSVNIPSGVTSIGQATFYYCSSLTSITIPNSVTSISDSAFDNTPWWNTYSADTSHHYGNIIYINDVAYKAASTEITSCTFKEGTVSISNQAFDGCSGLTSVSIPSSVTSISTQSFRNCSGLTSIEIPNSVTSIGNEAFSICIGLTSIEIPSGVTSIGRSAFRSCSGLTSITVNATTPLTLSSGAFDNTNDCPIYVPSASVDAYKAASNWSAYSDRIFAIS